MVEGKEGIDIPFFLKWVILPTCTSLKIKEVLPAEFSRITLDEKSFEINGDLTIKGITHPISFVLEPVGSKSYVADLSFDRSKYDVRFRSGSFFENLGDKLILDDIEFALNAEPETLDDFKPMFEKITTNCQSCHQVYRLK